MKNKKHRIFSRVLGHLAWADFYHACNENGNSYKEILAAKRCLEECGFENVKVDFYNGEYRLYFEVYHPVYECNRYYIVSAVDGYGNRYHVTNCGDVNRLIEQLEREYSRALSVDFHDYCMFNEVVGDVLFDGLTINEYVDYCKNGKIEDIPYDVAITLWRDLRTCLWGIVNEAVAQRKVVF